MVSTLFASFFMQHWGLCAGCYHEKEIEARPEPLHNFTDFEFDSF
jgi:hypothetical protein